MSLACCLLGHGAEALVSLPALRNLRLKRVPTFSVSSPTGITSTLLVVCCTAPRSDREAEPV